MKLRYFPVIFTAVLMAAHFLRSYSLIPMAIYLLAPFLLLIRERLSILAFQLLTIPATTIWLITLNDIIQERVFEHSSWTASAIIWGVVALFTLFARWLMNSPKIKDATLYNQLVNQQVEIR